MHSYADMGALKLAALWSRVATVLFSSLDGARLMRNRMSSRFCFILPTFYYNSPVDILTFFFFVSSLSSIPHSFLSFFPSVFFIIFFPGFPCFFPFFSVFPRFFPVFSGFIFIVSGLRVWYRVSTYVQLKTEWYKVLMLWHHIVVVTTKGQIRWFSRRE